MNLLEALSSDSMPEPDFEQRGDEYLARREEEYVLAVVNGVREHGAIKFSRPVKVIVELPTFELWVVAPLSIHPSIHNLTPSWTCAQADKEHPHHYRNRHRTYSLSLPLLSLTFLGTLP